MANSDNNHIVRGERASRVAQPGSTGVSEVNQTRCRLRSADQAESASRQKIQTTTHSEREWLHSVSPSSSTNTGTTTTSVMTEERWEGGREQSKGGKTVSLSIFPSRIESLGQEVDAVTRFPQALKTVELLPTGAVIEINKKFLMSWRLDHIKGFLLMSTLTIPLTLTLTIPLTSTWGVFINYVFHWWLPLL